MCDDLEQELRNQDATEFPSRLARLREIEEWLDRPELGLSRGPDFEATQSFQEARLAYVNGLWLSAIVLSQISIERHLAWRLAGAGIKKTERMAAKDLVSRARTQGLLSDQQAADIIQLCSDRNDFAHYRATSRFWNTVFAQRQPIAENDEVGIDINLVLQPAARQAVQVATAYLLASG